MCGVERVEDEFEVGARTGLVACFRERGGECVDAIGYFAVVESVGNVFFDEVGVGHGMSGDSPRSAIDAVWLNRGRVWCRVVSWSGLLGLCFVFGFGTRCLVPCLVWCWGGS